jgi:hypothetical protein
MKSLLPILLLFACADDVESPEDLAAKEQANADRAEMRAILDRLQLQTASLTVSEAGRGVLPGEATAETNAEHLKEIYDLLLYLENRVLELENEGVMRAQDVSFDPRATKISAKKVQGALTEIEVRLQEIEDDVFNNAGAPGEGLYSLDGGGMGPPRGQHETQGKHDGDPNIPPGGGGGGGMGHGQSGSSGGGGMSGGMSGGGQSGGQGGSQGGGQGGSQGGGGMRGNTGQ